MLSIYYPGEAPEIFPARTQSELMSGSTAHASAYNPITQVFAVIQLTSLYALLLAALVLIGLEFRQLHYLKLLVAHKRQ